MHVDYLDEPKIQINEFECSILDVIVYCTVYRETQKPAS